MKSFILYFIAVGLLAKSEAIAESESEIVFPTAEPDFLAKESKALEKAISLPTGPASVEVSDRDELQNRTADSDVALTIPSQVLHGGEVAEQFSTRLLISCKETFVGFILYAGGGNVFQGPSPDTIEIRPYTDLYGRFQYHYIADDGGNWLVTRLSLNYKDSSDEFHFNSWNMVYLASRNNYITLFSFDETDKHLEWNFIEDKDGINGAVPGFIWWKYVPETDTWHIEVTHEDSPSAEVKESKALQKAISSPTGPASIEDSDRDELQNRTADSDVALTIPSQVLHGGEVSKKNPDYAKRLVISCKEYFVGFIVYTDYGTNVFQTASPHTLEFQIGESYGALRYYFTSNTGTTWQVARTSLNYDKSSDDFLFESLEVRYLASRNNYKPMFRLDEKDKNLEWNFIEDTDGINGAKPAFIWWKYFPETDTFHVEVVQYPELTLSPLADQQDLSLIEASNLKTEEPVGYEETQKENSEG